MLSCQVFMVALCLLSLSLTAQCQSAAAIDMARYPEQLGDMADTESVSLSLKLEPGQAPGEIPVFDFPVGELLPAIIAACTARCCCMGRTLTRLLCPSSDYDRQSATIWRYGASLG